MYSSSVQNDKNVISLGDLLELMPLSHYWPLYPDVLNKLHQQMLILVIHFQFNIFMHKMYR